MCTDAVPLMLRQVRKLSEICQFELISLPLVNPLPGVLLGVARPSVVFVVFGLPHFIVDHLQHTQEGSAALVILHLQELGVTLVELLGRGAIQ